MPNTGYFHDKTKDLQKKNLQVSYYLQLNNYIAEGNVAYLASLQLDQVNYKIYPKNARF